MICNFTRVNMPRKTLFLIVPTLLVSLSACTTMQPPGAALAVAPRPVAPASAAAAGQQALLAAMQGGLIGRVTIDELSERNRSTGLQAEYRALEYTPPGESVIWDDQQSGATGTVIASQPYRVGSQDCRQLEHTVTRGRSQQSERGTACRNPDGSWTIVS